MKSPNSPQANSEETCLLPESGCPHFQTARACSPLLLACTLLPSPGPARWVRTPWQPLQLLLGGACWWEQVCQALLMPRMGGGSFPNARLLLDGLCGEGEACLERVPGMVGALSRVQPGSAVAQPPRAAGTSRGIRRAQLSPCGCIDIKVYIRCLLYARPKLGLGGILQKISQSPLL